MLYLIALLFSWVCAAPIPVPTTANCGHNNQIAPHRALARKSLQQKIAQIGEADRKSASDFGAKNGTAGLVIEKRYAASGDITCPNGGGQGQITIKNDTIVTSAHIFDAGLNCKVKDSITDCQFITKVNGIEKFYKFKAEVGSGHVCPLPPGKTHSATNEDWVVLKLTQATDPRIKPYKIPMNGQNILTAGQKVVAVAKSADWPQPGKSAIRDFPRHYGDCEAVTVNPNGKSGLVMSTCDMSAGSSGGGMFTPGEDPVLQGIVRGETDPSRAKGCEAQVENQKADKGDFVQGCWAGQMVPVIGTFKQAIMTATGITESGSGRSSAPPGTRDL